MEQFIGRIEFYPTENPQVMARNLFTPAIV